MSDYQRLDDGIRWQIVGRLETGQCEVQICREFNLTPSIVCNLWKQLQDIGLLERKHRQVRLRATTPTSIEDQHLSIIARHNRQLFSYSLLVCSHRNPCIKGDCFKKTS
ncbi:uncharacterized protein TNCV_1544721 [Trichonephila clavipes]|nr:uncharacterized protein TNCV_1544721 [Trichonephila clavipes]